jgi:hypothetical protein
MVNKDRTALSENLIEVAKARQLKCRAEILSREVVEEAVCMTVGEPGRRSSRDALNKAVGDFKKLCANRKSRAYRMIYECKD